MLAIERRVLPRRLLFIPAGTKILGEVTAVEAFARLGSPYLPTVSSCRTDIPESRPVQGLNQIGDAGYEIK